MKRGEKSSGHRMIPGRKARRSAPAEEPLEVQLTVAFRFGERPDDYVTVIDDRRIPMVSSVFDSRDTIVRGFVKLLMKASVTQPSVLREILPAVKLLPRPFKRRA